MNSTLATIDVLFTCSGEEVQTLKDVLLMLTNPKNIPANVSEAQAKKMLVGFIKRFITRYM
jgi:hypothetical protein